MNNHYSQALRLCNRINAIQGVSKIVLYGSVVRGEEKASSDIDLAVILDDMLRAFSSGFSEFPEIEELRIREMSLEEEKFSGIKNHVALYWDSEYEKGIILDSGKYPRKDLLHQVGRTLFERDLRAA